MELIKGRLPDETATATLARHLAPVLRQQHTQLHLEGPLGAGKTSLVRGLLRAWGYEDSVKSPTYTLAEAYELPDFTILHVDLYRLNTAESLFALGLEDPMAQARVVCIEWPCPGLPLPDVTCILDFSGDNKHRVFTLYGSTAWGEKALEVLARTLPHSLQ